ncbi:MAG: TAT-variant-translocated molybdopterin oxidoreductase, partial [Ignavibacteriae bacterium]|nr:TAT-variant-translocated molybdopterin oxidoreductase [Ignavibacteriota bacterium]
MSNKIGTKNIWKSIKEYQEDPEVLEAKLHEFKQGVTDDFDPDQQSTFSRRKFLAVLAASTAYAATACTNYRDKGEIVPYVKRPEEILPGKPTYYASTFAEDGLSYGVLVKTREGRPIKVEGNPDDPINKGKIPSRVHASILNLYDPDRLQSPTISKVKSSWKIVNEEIASKLAEANSANKEIAVFTNHITSPTTAKVLDEFKLKFPSVKIYTTHLANDNNRVSAWKKCYDQNILPSIKWNKAKIIVALESDFLGKEGNTVENRANYALGRDIVNTKELSKLYSVEGAMSLTGMNSDIRLRLNPQLQFEFVLSLANQLMQLGAFGASELSDNVISLIRKNSLNNFAEKSGLQIEKLKLIAKDLAENKSNSILVAGDALNEKVHIFVNLLNDLLGNNSLYNYDHGFLIDSEISTPQELKSFVAKCNDGKIAAVINLDANPVYELPTSLGLSDALSKVETIISLSEAPNETTNLSKYILPLHNYLEAWGDHKTRNGLLTLQQPVISPLFDTKQKEEILLSWINTEPVDYHKYLMENFKTEVFDTNNSIADFNTYWLTSLHDGIVKTYQNSITENKFDQSIVKDFTTSIDGFTVLIQNNYSFGTGKYANNGWLQELPHPVTKVAWDNFAAVAQRTAEKLNIVNDDLIEISVNGKSIKLPTMVQPGMAEDTIAIELGYGRKNSGEVANEVGFNVNELLNENNLSQFIFGGATIKKTGEVYKLASTQEHHSLDDEFVKDLHLKRNIIQEGTLEEYKNNP